MTFGHKRDIGARIGVLLQHVLEVDVADHIAVRKHHVFLGAAVDEVGSRHVVEHPAIAEKSLQALLVHKEFEKRRDKWFEDEEVRKREKEFERKRKENSQSNNTNKQKVDYSTLSPELLKAYAVLGLDPSASTSEVKSQKNNLLKRFHPDLFANQGDEMINKATKKTQSINQAYETIMKGRA